ncbi:transposase [Ruegeria sp. MALMAid1280]|uniref:transposase n=1 Tax=Ruegeria sp. MALMAid1280 TaxID=3411634 RepID=UPI003BA0C475
MVRQRSSKRGGQQRYSDLAIGMCLTLRGVFGLPLRLTQGFVRSQLQLVELDLPVPDYATLCRPTQTLLIVPDIRTVGDPITLVVDSTGLRDVGSRDWMREKHDRRRPYSDIHAEC